MADRPTIDLNADLGESAQPDRLALDGALLGIVSSANIACGGHAGDERTMSACTVAAAAHGVALGAHPSYPDRSGFGRRAMTLDPGALRRSLVEQLDALRRIADRHGVTLRHVKPHGALYHAAMTDPAVAQLVAESAAGLRLVGQAGSRGLEVWRSMGRAVLAEAFADRRYRRDGSLVPRSHASSMITDPEEAAAQAVRIAVHGRLTADDGADIAITAGTICVHSDTPGARAVAGAVRAGLESAGVQVRCPVD
ncbi:MAG: 5-oxoprolinase subunit PxpA [Phycisphaerales bacterium]